MEHDESPSPFSRPDDVGARGDALAASGYDSGDPGPRVVVGDAYPEAPSRVAAPAAAPIRLPQPPPVGFGEEHDAPGSPEGSVRPPDMGSTADASVRPSAERKRPRGIATALLAGIVGAVLGTTGTLVAVRNTSAYNGPSVQSPVVISDGDAGAVAGSGSVVPAVAQAVTPSVVRIDILQRQRNGTDIVESEAGLGSGVIYRSDGYILTNAHVVQVADAVRVRLSTGETLDGEIVGVDELNDLAVIKVDRVGLPAIQIREEKGLRVGETAIAIGSPFGLDASVTAGVISAMNRDLQVPREEGALVIPAVIQTDAAINPGNSGGALVDAQGRLIGINTAILTGSGGSQGVGFAVPVTQAVSSADQLISQGFVRAAFLGIAGVNLDPATAEEFGLDLEGGAVVDDVQADTAAAEAGLQPGDIIVAVDGEPIDTMTDLVVEIRLRSPGDEMTLRIARDGEFMDVTVTLGERPR